MNFKTMMTLTVSLFVFAAAQVRAQWKVQVSYNGSLSCSRLVAGAQPVATVGNDWAWLNTPVGNTQLAPLSNIVPALPMQNPISIFNGYLRDQVQSTQSQAGYFTIDLLVQWVGAAPAPDASLQLELWANKTRMGLLNWNGQDAVAQLSQVSLTNRETLLSAQGGVSAPNFLPNGPANQFSTAQSFLTLPLKNGRGYFRLQGKESLYMRFLGGNGSVGACETRVNLSIF